MRAEQVIVVVVWAVLMTFSCIAGPVGVATVQLQKKGVENSHISMWDVTINGETTATVNVTCDPLRSKLSAAGGLGITGSVVLLIGAVVTALVECVGFNPVVLGTIGCCKLLAFVFFLASWAVMVDVLGTSYPSCQDLFFPPSRPAPTSLSNMTTTTTAAPLTTTTTATPGTIVGYQTLRQQGFEIASGLALLISAWCALVAGVVALVLMLICKK